MALIIGLASQLLWASPRPPKDVYVVHFILDGLRYDVFKKYVESGNYPDIKKYFVDKGAWFHEATGTFPTPSPVVYTSFFTGLHTSHSGVPALQWFDREKEKGIDYLSLRGKKHLKQSLGPNISIFEKLAPAPTLTLYNPFTRGETQALPKLPPISFLWRAGVTHDGAGLDRPPLKKLFKIFHKPVGKLPRYTVVSLFGSDYIGHHKGPTSRELEKVFIQFDNFLAHFMKLLKEQGIFDKTYLVLSSDHGSHATETKFDLTRRIKSWEINVRKNMFITNRGVSSNFIYVRGEKGWQDFPTLEFLRHYPTQNGPIDLVENLRQVEELDWIAVREGADQVRIFSKMGEGIVETENVDGKTLYGYHPQGEDPFDYAEDKNLRPFLDGKLYDADFWGPKTAAASYPDAVVQLAELFQGTRTGDILVMAKAPWLFRTNKLGTHGSLQKEDMRILLAMTGPTIKKKKGGFARAVDLYPTMLDWFGIAVDEKTIDGKNLFKEP